MCGIAGMIGLSAEESTLNQMLATMKNRGPDDSGIFFDCDCCLLHSRLSIVDLRRGHQPMNLKWGREEYTIVYNGELYNTAELRDLLIRLGHHFESHSDTEVVLHAYAQWSEACLDRFNGIFAFAIWEHKRKKLFLARDRMGVKPLFYKAFPGGIIFASEIKTILAHPAVDAELDETGAMQLVMLGPGRMPGSGVFRNIKELEPGCFGYFCNGKWNWKRYWQLKDREHTESFEETAEHVQYLVVDAIKRQMVSDVPIGTFLSGGLDSSIISAICAEDMRNRGMTLATFSVDYTNNDRFFKPGKFQPDSDNLYIEIMRSFLQSEHRNTVLDSQALIDALPAATMARDLPGMADVDASLLLFCGHMRKHVKVGLSGECADEIFGGYPWYRDPEVRSIDGFPWAQNTRQRVEFLHPVIRSQTEPEDFVRDVYADTISRCDILPDVPPLERRMREMVNLNTRWFMQTLLDRKDRMSMAQGLEVRVPFCDHRIVEYLYSVPWEYKDHNGREKGLLRYAMQGYLPDKIINRKKSPYPKTYDPAYLAALSRMLRELLLQKDAPIFSIINRSTLESLLTSEYSWPWYGQLMKVPQTIAYMLQINEWLDLYKVRVI